MNSKDFTLKTKLGIILLIALLGLAYFAGNIIIGKQTVLSDMERNKTLRDLGVKVSDLVHELQKERGATAGFLGSKGKKFSTELLAQKKVTNEKLALFNGFVDGYSDEDLDEIIQKARAALGNLDSKRGAVASFNIKAGEAIGYYTKTNAALLDIIGGLPNLITDGEVANHFVGYFILQQIKEPMGIERAVLSGTFAADKFGPGMYEKLIELIKAQAMATSIFNSIMPADDRDALKNGVTGTALNETNRMREVALSKAKEGGFGIDATYWFKTQTDKINLMNNNVIRGHLQYEMTRITEKRTEEAKSGLLFSWIVGLIVIAAVVAISFFIIRNITKTIAGTVSAITEITSGDFTQSVEISSNDEIGSLGAMVNTMVDELRAMFIQINENTVKLASSSEELTSISSHFAGGSEKMSLQAATVAAATEQMSSNINSMASAVEQSSVNASSVSSTAEEMSVNMGVIANNIDQMTLSIKDVAQHTQETSKIAIQAVELSSSATGSMKELGSSADEIGKVTEMIKRIAEQTNLLALNATIEAASAGDAGKGFAVVANEIKELANQSAQAAEDITTKIEGVQDSANNSIKVISDVLDIINRISESVDIINSAVEKQNEATQAITNNVSEANKGSNNIASSISEIAKGTSDISKNAGEAAKSANEVSMNIQGISKAVQDNADGIQQINDSVNELAAITADIKGMMEKFKVSSNGHTAVRMLEGEANASAKLN